jgi:hypothetical protein
MFCRLQHFFQKLISIIVGETARFVIQLFVGEDVI